MSEGSASAEGSTDTCAHYFEHVHSRLLVLYATVPSQEVQVMYESINNTNRFSTVVVVLLTNASYFLIKSKLIINL